MQIASLLSLVSLLAAAMATPDELGTSPRRDLEIIKVSSGQAIQPDTDISDLQARACNYNGCRCRKGLKPGVYCGSCSDGDWLITKKRVEMHAYQCAKDGSCCSYGIRKNCNDWGGKCPE